MFDDVVVFCPCPACCTSCKVGAGLKVGCFCTFVLFTLLYFPFQDLVLYMKLA